MSAFLDDCPAQNEGCDTCRTGAPSGPCDASPLWCGHHCNCVFDDECCWCGTSYA